MADLDLKDALLMFQGGLRDLAQSNAINEANSVVQQIRTSSLKDQEKQAELQNVANQLTMRLTQSGASPQAIAQSAEALSPAPPKDAQEALLRGMVKGDKLSEEAGMRLLSLTQKPEKKERLVASEIKTVADFEASKKELSGLLEKVSEDSDLTGWWTGKAPSALRSNKARAFQAQLEQAFNQYRVAVTGAGASEGEIEKLKEAFVSMQDNPELFKEKTKVILEKMNNQQESFMSSLEAGGKDIDNFRRSGSGQQGAGGLSSFLKPKTGLR